MFNSLGEHTFREELLSSGIHPAIKIAGFLLGF